LTVASERFGLCDSLIGLDERDWCDLVIL
jgi:hypothetical protein